MSRLYQPRTRWGSKKWSGQVPGGTFGFLSSNVSPCPDSACLTRSRRQADPHCIPALHERYQAFLKFPLEASGSPKARVDAPPSDEQQTTLGDRPQLSPPRARSAMKSTLVARVRVSHFRTIAVGRTCRGGCQRGSSGDLLSHTARQPCAGLL